MALMLMGHKMSIFLYYLVTCKEDEVVANLPCCHPPEQNRETAGIHAGVRISWAPSFDGLDLNRHIQNAVSVANGKNCYNAELRSISRQKHGSATSKTFPMQPFYRGSTTF